MPRPRKPSPSKSQSSLSGSGPPRMKGAKKGGNIVVTPRVAPEISFIEPPAPDEAEIPEQKEHLQLPTRFGAVPVDEAGCEATTGCGSAGCV